MKLRFCLVLIFFCYVYATPRTISYTSTGTKSRYAYLMEYMINGQRNVRWETMPANYVDSNGKPVPFAGNKGGSVVVGCYDAQGSERKNGEEYQRPNKKFWYKCVNGIEEVVACVGSDRANRARIKVGETLDVDGFWHKCASHPNGSVIYTQEDACIQNGKNIHVGEEVRVGYLRVICQNEGYKAIGCYYSDENNHPISMKKGTTKSAGKVTHHCEDQGGDIRYFSTATGCTKRGKDYDEGQEWKENHLYYKCENGVVEIKGCYIDDKHDLAVGQDVVDPNHMKMGNDMVQNPSTLKLDLDKIFMGHQMQR